ncbi:hypothetical protein NDU88_004746 [Pleurodeles waltl]|uniref:Uncharacterized protein n=1 Tax=Pleurodeles waltl TaxID=8319 RepID=A0AAV7W7K5_PLEWA|nr:hypothetical protein NDU88_004746 [Pleurodeles waltl]
MYQVLPDSIPIDSSVASLVRRTSLAEDTIAKDAVDKKVDGSLKKVYSGAHLAVRAGIYGTVVSQFHHSQEVVLPSLTVASEGHSDFLAWVFSISNEGDDVGPGGNEDYQLNDEEWGPAEERFPCRGNKEQEAVSERARGRVYS